ncbi:adenylyltransferase/cytidyltransferase family protein [Candidatus Sumerlaeota bacterium]|nr:adenylyltransferase/cytidyltransferase family protein [Candidatus Sumerlaeota bacterium]
MKKVFVSGCYDILHAGHIQFFAEAKALGDHLTVSFASDEVLWEHKKRRSSIPQDHKNVLLQSLSMVDNVVMGTNMELGLDFQDHFLELKPDILVVTEDDQFEKEKRALCARVGAEYCILPKTPPRFEPVSTSHIVKWIRAPKEAPLRVDFAGGWLDVPRFARPGGFIVNCAISPLVSLMRWDYEQRSGLGGSGAWAVLNGEDGVDSELDLGVGWQDPAVIHETGLCVWESGPRPVLRLKRNGEMLRGLMALLYTGAEHDTPGIAARTRKFDWIYEAGRIAAKAVLEESLDGLAEGVRLSYKMQIDEGMNPLIEADKSLARKYCGGGWGGYAVYLFASPEDRDRFVASDARARPIEPYLKTVGA